MEFKVDQNACIGCGACAGTAPDVFVMDDNGLATVVSQPGAEGEALARDAMDACPVNAISAE